MKVPAPVARTPQGRPEAPARMQNIRVQAAPLPLVLLEALSTAQEVLLEFMRLAVITEAKWGTGLAKVVLLTHPEGNILLLVILLLLLLFTLCLSILPLVVHAQESLLVAVVVLLLKLLVPTAAN